MDYTALLNMLRHEEQLARQLLSCLQEEKSALGAEAEAILALTTRKEGLLEALEHSHEQRAALLIAHDCTPDSAGMNALIAQHDVDDKLARQWQAVLDVVAQCREHNQVNGRLVELNRQVVRQALSILHGQGPAGATSGYGASGESLEQPLSRTLGKV